MVDDAPNGWFFIDIAPGVVETKPGIYEWKIDGLGSYIGKFTHISGPRKEYGRNVARLQAKLPYRPSNKDGFRHVHRELAKAIEEGARITLSILENVDAERLNAREQELIGERGTLNRTPRRAKSSN